MQNQNDITIILQNPDGTIRLATQPHVKNKKILECWKCHNKLVYNVKSKYVQCCYCESINAIVTPEEQMGIIVQCQGCNLSLRANPNVLAVSCPVCRFITPVLL